MTSGDLAAEEPNVPGEPLAAEIVADFPTPATRWGLYAEELLDRAGDWLNPILVKETRQALKSKQFSVTFGLLLLLGWFWTALFVVFTIPTVYYVPLGPYVLGGYLFILTIPLLIVVPYAAFRSLAAEREDGTFELLSITTLAARQIILGKLGSAIVQMTVYYSALAPCVAFTYLLRGLDILTIAHVLGYTFLASLALSALGLTLATATRSRHWQLLLSVIFVMALLIVAGIWFGIMVSLLAVPTSMYDQWQFWLAQSMVLSFYAAYVWLFLQIAAGQISFASDNRSTPLRVILFVIQLLIIGWSVCYAKCEDFDLIMVMVIGSILHWILAGVFLTAEHAKLSPRVLRSLPQSLVGRMFLTWFNPGQINGYLFATTCTLGTLLLAAMFDLGWDWLATNRRTLGFDQWSFMFGAVGYFCFYLGFSRLIVMGLGRLGQPLSMLLSILIQVLVAFLVCLIPLFMATAFHNWNAGGLEYNAWQIPNWMWTLERAGDGYFNSDPTVVGFVFTCGLGMYVLHMVLAIPETAKRRLLAPERVRKEDSATGKKRVEMFEI